MLRCFAVFPHQSVLSLTLQQWDDATLLQWLRFKCGNRKRWCLSSSSHWFTLRFTLMAADVGISFLLVNDKHLFSSRCCATSCVYHFLQQGKWFSIRHGLKVTFSIRFICDYNFNRLYFLNNLSHCIPTVTPGFKVDQSAASIAAHTVRHAFLIIHYFLLFFTLVYIFYSSLPI